MSPHTELLKEAAALFRFYEESHRAKGPGHETKVARNADIAARIEAALDAAGRAAVRGPLTADQVRELARSAGYATATAESRADFINGIRHAELAYGITAQAQQEGGR